MGFLNNREVVQITACFRVQLICNCTETTVALNRCNLYCGDDLTSHIHLQTIEKYNGIACALTSDNDLLQKTTGMSYFNSSF